MIELFKNKIYYDRQMVLTPSDWNLPVKVEWSVKGHSTLTKLFFRFPDLKEFEFHYVDYFLVLEHFKEHQNPLIGFFLEILSNLRKDALFIERSYPKGFDQIPEITKKYEKVFNQIKMEIE